MLQRAPDEIWGPAPRNCMHTSDTTAGVHGSSAQKPSARGRCLAPLRPAPLPPLLLQPAAAHLEGVEEVPEGPGVDDVVVRAEEEGHHHAGHACRDRTRGPEERSQDPPQGPLCLAGPPWGLAPRALRVGLPSAALPASSAVKPVALQLRCAARPQAHFADGEPTHSARPRPPLPSGGAGIRASRHRRQTLQLPAPRPAYSGVTGATPYSVVAGAAWERCQARRGRGLPCAGRACGEPAGLPGDPEQSVGVWRASARLRARAPLRDLSSGLPYPTPPGRGGW